MIKIGAENKKALYALTALGLILAYEFYDNVLSGPSAPSSSSRPKTAAATNDATGLTSDGAAAPIPVPGATPKPSTQPPRVPGRAVRNDSFMPVYISKRPENRTDTRHIDPTLHLELLAKLQNVPPAGGRDLFNWAAAPAPVSAKLEGLEPRYRPVGPVVHLPQPPGAAPPPPPPPPPPPITLKYYGIATRLDNGRKTAFFMDGEEILLETEGTTFGRYKLLHLGVDSATIEDTQYKRQQILPLEEAPKGS